MTPGLRIRTRRKELGLRQGELARRVGMAQSALSEIEKGESRLPNAEHLIKLAAELGVTQAWIITGKPGGVEVLSADEERLFSRLRQATPEQRAAIVALVDSLGID